MKVFGIGLNKTGTKTLGECLRMIGLNVLNRSARIAFGKWEDGGPSALIPLVNDHDAFEDWPWPLCYSFLDGAFPGSKFILTTRITPDVWFESLCRHAERTGPTKTRLRIYGHDMPHHFRRGHIDYYNRHNYVAQRFFESRPSDFLEICWEKGDGWQQLAPFLGVAIPERPVPHLNARNPQSGDPRST